MKEPKVCYGLLPSQLLDPSVKKLDVIILKEGESGYYATDWKWDREFAERARDQKNAALGVSPAKADKMMSASMWTKKMGVAAGYCRTKRDAQNEAKQWVKADRKKQ